MNNNRRKGFARSATGTLLAVALAAAASADGPRASLGVSAFGVFDADTRGAITLGLEGSELEALWSIRPTLQWIARPEGNWYLGAGRVREFALSETWSWGLGAGLGVYHEGGGKDLGQPLEFHTRGFVAWRMVPGQQLRLEIEHLSNADLDKINPGVDLLSLSWVFAL